MKTTTRFVNDYLHAIIAGQRHAEIADAALLERFANGNDGDAFAELLRRHGHMVLGLARRVVADRQAAEDVYQATFLVLARRARTLQRAESLAAWLHSVAYRLALRARKAGVRRREQETRARTAHATRDPLDELSARELLAVLDEELQRLPDYHRLPLILCGLEGLSQEEAARRLGWSAGSMKGRLERGRAQLRRLLEKRGLTLPAALAGTLLLSDWATAVPAALVEATRRVALTGSGASSAVLSLSNHALGMALATKVKSLVGLLAAIGVLSVGLGLWQGPPVPPVEAPVAQQPVAGEQRDLHGDPLPDSALLRLGTVQRRAVGARLALSADGKTIIGVRANLYVHVWDAATGLLIERHQLEWPDVSVPIIEGVHTLSRHGRKLATDDYASEALHVWDVLTGKELRKFPLGDGGAGGGGPADGPSGLQAVAFSNDENRLAAVIRTGKKYTLRAWDLKVGKEILDTQVQGAGSTDILTFTPDGKRLLVSNAHGLGAYDLVGGKQLWLAKDIPAPALYALTPDRKILIQGNGIVAWDLATGNPAPFENRPPETWDGALAVTPDGKTLLVSGTKGVLVWDLVQGKEVRTLAGAGEEMVLAADAKSVLTSNGLLQRWDIATGKPFYPDTFDQGHAGEVLALAFSADGKRLASGSADGSVRLWDAATARPLHVWRGHEVRRPIRISRWTKAGVTAVDIARDGSRVVSAGTEESVRVWDAVTGKPVHVIPLPNDVAGLTDRFVPILRLRTAGTRITAQCGAHGFTGVVGDPPVIDTRPRLATWNLKTGALLHSVPTSAGVAAFSGDGDFLFADGVMTDLVTGKPQARLEKTESEGPEAPYAVSRDGLLIATGLARRGKQDGVEFIGPAGGAVWDARTGKRVARIPTTSWFGGIAFHPDGRHVAVNDLGGIQIVDVTAGEVVARYEMPERIRAGTTPGSYASCMAFTPDGARLATGHPDGSILMWSVALPKPNREPLAAAEAAALWADLAKADAAVAWKAVWRLGESPEASLPIIRKHVQAVAPAVDAITAPLLADLGSDSFERREAAQSALRKLGFRAEPALREHQDDKLPLEAKRRMAALLKEITESPTPEMLQQVRAVAVLARIDSPEARRILHDLAQGVRLAPLTRAARATLNRDAP